MDANWLFHYVFNHKPQTGNFSTAEEAGVARDCMIRDYLGEVASLNFPDISSFPSRHRFWKERIKRKQLLKDINFGKMVRFWKRRNGDQGFNAYQIIVYLKYHLPSDIKPKDFRIIAWRLFDLLRLNTVHNKLKKQYNSTYKDKLIVGSISQSIEPIGHLTEDGDYKYTDIVIKPEFLQRENDNDHVFRLSSPHIYELGQHDVKDIYHPIFSSRLVKAHNKKIRRYRESVLKLARLILDKVHHGKIPPYMIHIILEFVYDEPSLYPNLKRERIQTSFVFEEDPDF